MERTSRKRAFRGKTKNKREKQSKTNNDISDTSHYLTYDVLRIIFKNLKGLELSNVSMVCRTWMDAAVSECRTRRYPAYFVGDVRKLSKLPGHVTVNFLKQVVKEIMIKPKAAFLITHQIEDMRGCHCRFLPSNCDIITVATCGIVVNDTEIENNTSKLSCIFLPDVPGVTVKTTVFEDFSVYKIMDINCIIDIYSQQIFEVPSNDVISTNTKCVILLCNRIGRNIGKRLSRHWYLKGVSTVWGGIVQDIKICSFEHEKRYTCNKRPVCVGITISGASMRTWSVIIDSCCVTKKEVEDKLRSFRNSVQLQKYSMGFMFACYARGLNIYDEKNMESKVFKSFFPKVPLVGCFGDGEFGKNTTPNEPPDTERRTCYHEVSTVFMILTYS